MRKRIQDVYCRVCGKDLIARYDCRGQRLCSTHYKVSRMNPARFNYLLALAEGRETPPDARAREFDSIRRDKPLLEAWDRLAAKRKPRKTVPVNHFWR